MTNEERRQEPIVFGKPQLSEEDISEVVETIRSGWIGSGPKVIKFEQHLRSYLGARNAVAVQSCTGALFLALELIGVGAGDEVITTPITFPATANVVVHHGAKPVFADVERATGNIDPEQILAKISNRTKAIIPVHLAGNPCDMDSIMAIAENNGLAVIEDAAHALDATYKGEQVGTIGKVGAFSFYPTKSLTTGEGGLLVTADDDLAARARILRLHGIDSDAWERSSDPDQVHYETVEAGYKQNLSDLQAALGLHQIERLQENLEHRRTIWKIYDEGLRGLAGITLPAEAETTSRHARHLYIIYVDKEHARLSRDQLKLALYQERIGTGIHFTSLHLHKYYRDSLSLRPADLPNATWISERTLSLPIGNGMTIQDAERVVTTMKKLLGEA